MIRILQIYIGAGNSLDAPLSDTAWEALLQETVKQSLQGVLFEVIRKLPPPLIPPRKIKIQCALMAETIAGKNELMNHQCTEIVKAIIQPYRWQHLWRLFIR